MQISLRIWRYILVALNNVRRGEIIKSALLASGAYRPGARRATPPSRSRERRKAALRYHVIQCAQKRNASWPGRREETWPNEVGVRGEAYSYRIKSSKNLIKR